jgi:protein-L-isoaspartate(D-aspartate) O-methyltransferase
MTGEAPSRRHRHDMVSRLVASGAVTSGAVEQAMRTVPRHRLLRDVWLHPTGRPAPGGLEHHRIDSGTDPATLARLYDDIAVPTRLTQGVPSTSTSQPSLVAHMLEQLELDRGMRVLEIGAGTGYQAALMAELVGDPTLVHTVDIAGEVVTQTSELLADIGYGGIRVICADGAAGHEAGAPYDRIIATAGCPDIAPAWLRQLSPGGFALVPLLHAGAHPLTRVVPSPPAAAAIGRVVGSAGFMPLQGAMSGRLHWPSGKARDQRHEPLPPELAGVEGDAAWPGWDFHYYLSLADGRTTGTVALADHDGSVRVDFPAGALLTTGDSDHLRRALLEHRGAWDRLGRPRAGDWRSTFTAVASPLPPSDYVIPRIHHRQGATLGRGGGC